MADYFSPTVIQPSIPVADMTPLEHLALSAIFDSEPDDDALYFHSSDGPNDMIWLSSHELRAAIAASAATGGTTSTYVAEHLIGADTDGAQIEIDFSGTSWRSSFRTLCVGPPR